MERGALVEPEFKAFAQDYVLFCHITTRVTSDPYQNLLTEKGGGGFPYLVYMDDEGHVLARHEGPRTVEGFRGSRKKVDEFLALKSRAENGDANAQLELLEKQLELNHLKPADAYKKIDAIKGLAPDRRAKLTGLAAASEMQEAMANVAEDRSTWLPVGKRFAEMKKAGRVPQGRDAVNFWYFLMVHAEDQKDAKLFEEGLKEVKGAIGNNPRAAEFIQQQEETLKRLKQGAPK